MVAQRSLMYMKKCKNCGKTFTNKNAKYFCCRECYNQFYSTEHYNSYLQNNDIAYGIQNMSRYKKFFLKEQNYKCAICGISNIWEDKELVFVLDHIDGRADNNIRSNLRLICPNCDSQLDTYKSKNKNNDRKKYRKSYSKEPYVGNNISGCDDIGETLTDNADGNTEGMLRQPVESR